MIVARGERGEHQRRRRGEDIRAGRDRRGVEGVAAGEADVARLEIGVGDQIRGGGVEGLCREGVDGGAGDGDRWCEAVGVAEAEGGRPNMAKGAAHDAALKGDEAAQITGCLVGAGIGGDGALGRGVLRSEQKKRHQEA